MRFLETVPTASRPLPTSGQRERLGAGGGILLHFEDRADPSIDGSFPQGGFRWLRIHRRVGLKGVPTGLCEGCGRPGLGLPPPGRRACTGGGTPTARGGARPRRNTVGWGGAGEGMAPESTAADGTLRNVSGPSSGERGRVGSTAGGGGGPPSACSSGLGGRALGRGEGECWQGGGRHFTTNTTGSS